MTTSEFKEKYPQFAHLEGDELWDRMTVTFAEENGAHITEWSWEDFQKFGALQIARAADELSAPMVAMPKAMYAIPLGKQPDKPYVPVDFFKPE